jgi:hypothetical protein
MPCKTMQRRYLTAAGITAMSLLACSDAKIAMSGQAGSRGDFARGGTGGAAGSAGAAGSTFACGSAAAGVTGRAGSAIDTAGASGSGGAGGAVAPPAPCTAAQTQVARLVIPTDTTWSRCKTYLLPADAKVVVRAPAVLTIEAGVIVKGFANSALVVARGAKVVAMGTPAEPIVFTSHKPAGTRAPGDWGGLLLLGQAAINSGATSNPPSSEALFEAFAPSDMDGIYGGIDPDDSSGVLSYVRIEFGGGSTSPDGRWSQLTLAGVGRGTTIDHVQSHRSAADAIAFRGGTANVKHALLSQAGDDGFDTDNGWQGRAQFVVIQHVAPGGTDACHGYESENHRASTAYTAAPRTLPLVYNVTSIGRKDHVAGGSFGALFRRGTGGGYFNHIVIGWGTGAIEVRDPPTMDQIAAGNLFVSNSIFFDNGGADGNWPAPMADGDIDEKELFTTAACTNREVDPQLGDASSLTAPSFVPAAGSPALTGGATPPNDGFFDTTVTFVGAVGTDDWTAGWTSYPQN